MAYKKTNLRAVSALLFGALVWGVIWYPYRMLRDAGIGGIVGTTSVSALALCLSLLIFHRSVRASLPRWHASLALFSMAAAGCNLGYILAALNGEVVRVLLLFYLAPLWTVFLARVVLGERLNRCGVFVVVLSLSGALVILWDAQVGFPMPQNTADYLSLGAGFSFATFNVLSRYLHEVAIKIKAMLAFSGITVLGFMLVLAGIGDSFPATFSKVMDNQQLGFTALVLVLTALAIMLSNFIVQYGLARVAANRAIVIMLSEIAFAAIAAWLLADEVIGWREWLGGSMIIAATFISAKMERGETVNEAALVSTG